MLCEGILRTTVLIVAAVTGYICKVIENHCKNGSYAQVSCRQFCFLRSAVDKRLSQSSLLGSPKHRFGTIKSPL